MAVSKKKIFTDAYKKYEAIEDYKDLQRNKLTPCDHEMIYHCFNNLAADIKNGFADTISLNVAEWFKRNKFKVVNHGIGYRITVG